jgi:hypothetical protein
MIRVLDDMARVDGSLYDVVMRRASSLNTNVVSPELPLTSEIYIHGNTNPLLINANQSSLGSSYYFSLFHLVSNDAALNYTTYGFGFCPDPPFNIIYLTSKLNLQTSVSSDSQCSNPFAFATGSALTNCEDDGSSSYCLLISYGVCDKESYVDSIELIEFEKTFQILDECY